MNMTRAAMKERPRITLGVMILWIACCGVWCSVLKTVVDHREAVSSLWRELTGQSVAYRATPLKWSEPPPPLAPQRDMSR